MIDTTVNTNVISLPAKTIVGYRSNGSPIYNIAGGSVEFVETGSDDDAVDPLEDRDDDDDDGEEEDDWTPPSKDEWERLRAEKAKADSESAARKRILREHGINPKTGEPLKQAPPKLTSGVADDDDNDTDDTPKKPNSQIDARQIEKNLQRQMERTLLDQEQEVRNSERDRARALIGAIPEALNAEGWNGKAMPRILKLLDLDSVEVDDGEVDGLEDQIRELKADFPEFFRRARMKDAAKDVADKKTVGGGLKKTSPTKKEGTWAENIANALLGDG